MKTRLASLLLLFALASTAFAGIPLRFGDSECNMAGMMDMDCCKTALMPGGGTEAAAAKLLCALNCAQTGTTSSPNAVRVTPPAQARTPQCPAINPSLPNLSLRFRYHDRSHGPPDSPPVYLLNLALLI